MAEDAIVFAMANPTPEIDPVVASKHAAVVATGRSDFPNQINNVLAFPGMFRGLLDSRGVLLPGRAGVTGEKAALAQVTNPRGLAGGTAEAMAGADVFVGLSCAALPEELLALMAPGAFVFALSNPDPEVHPDVAARHAAIVATGRSDFPNQINNVLAFPGVFRGALDAGARRITEAMKLAAADAIFSVVADDLAPNRIVPNPFDPRVAPAVAAAVAQAARTEER